MKKNHILSIIGFIIIYSVFIFWVKIKIEFDVASELIVASVFFFALFSGFFIARQNDRYTRITDIIAERDGFYSCLYRVFGLIPRIQSEMREIIGRHYKKILETNNWAHNEFNPSTTMIQLTEAMGSVTAKEAKKTENCPLFDGIWDIIVQLQQNRKKIIAAYNERLPIFQWLLIYIFAALVLFSFHFLSTDYFWVDILKIVFGTGVFLVVVLIKQLNDLSFFGKNFSRNIAKDVLRILDEDDIKESGGKK